MNDLTEQLIKAMKTEFGKDRKRIDHALSVFKHAQEILTGEGGDSRVVNAAAILHDIGIQQAERKYGTSAGKYQELEGPPIARRIMEGFGLDQSVVEHVCRIVANHHSARDIDTREFRILWDADWLVNIPDEFKNFSKEELQITIEKIFKTETGKKIANKLYLE
jgi:HD superfamily phosphodiesterase